MRSIDLLLDKAREKCERPSDRALAEKLRVTASAVSKWRKGGVITEMHATALAAIAGLDGEIVVRVMEEQAETPAQRRVWRSVLDRLSAAAAVLMLVVVAAPGVAREKSFEIKGMEAGNAAVCILCFHRTGPNQWVGSHHFSFVSPQDLSEKPLRRTTFSAISYRRYQSEPSSPATGHDKPATR